MIQATNDNNMPHTLSGHPFRVFPAVLPLTPHSATLHVGLKSAVPSGRLWNIRYTIN
ncbi:hypothetical protein Barb6XT_01452 [Bacteroidales bacterium Barb6XT]|nr:hypothetical protein Barb6XT_01452 [Bacteroidales bacterium Barb6XT]